MRLVAVEPLQINRLPVQQNLLSSRRNRADAETLDDAVVFRVDFQRVEIRRFRRPETELRNRAFERFAVRDFRRPERLLRVETETDRMFFLRFPGEKEAERHFAGFNAERAHLHAVDR